MFFIIIFILIILIFVIYKKTRLNTENKNYAIPTKYYKGSGPLNNSAVDNNEDPYYIYADADKHHDDHADEDNEFHFDEFE